MLRKSLLTIGFFAFMTLGAALLNSCDTTDDTCGGLNITTYEAINFSGMPVEITGTSNAGQLLQISTYTYQTVRYDSIGLELTYDLNELGQKDRGISFIKSAFACSPVPPFDYLNIEGVYSNVDYNEAYPAGTDLSDIIRVSDDLSTSTENAMLDEELNGSAFMIIFNQAPEQAGTHEFRIEITSYRNIVRNLTVQFDQVTIRP